MDAPNRLWRATSSGVSQHPRPGLSGR
jgi:hypothetical protein